MTQLTESVKAAMRRECRTIPNARDIAESSGLLLSQQPVHEQEMGDPSQFPQCGIDD